MNVCRKIVAMLVLGVAVHLSLGEASAQSRRPATTGNPAAASINSAYWNRQATLARTNQNWSNMMRGVQTYRSPYSSQPVTLSNRYNYVWGNALGNHVYSNNANFNPNIHSNQNWQLMRPIR